MNDLKKPHHLSYLLRLWRTEGLQDFEWRASLEIPETGQRIGFANLEALFAFLRQRTGAASDSGGDEGESGVSTIP